MLHHYTNAIDGLIAYYKTATTALHSSSLLPYRTVIVSYSIYFLICQLYFFISFLL